MRGSEQKNRTVVSDPSVNQHQAEISETIKSYMGGELSKDQFVMKLNEK
jgi:hypothetical protein